MATHHILGLYFTAVLSAFKLDETNMKPKKKMKSKANNLDAIYTGLIQPHLCVRPSTFSPHRTEELLQRKSARPSFDL